MRISLLQPRRQRLKQLSARQRHRCQRRCQRQSPPQLPPQHQRQACKLPLLLPTRCRSFPLLHRRPHQVQHPNLLPHWTSWRHHQWPSLARRRHRLAPPSRLRWRLAPQPLRELRRSPLRPCQSLRHKRRRRVWHQPRAQPRRRPQQQQNRHMRRHLHHQRQNLHHAQHHLQMLLRHQ